MAGQARLPQSRARRRAGCPRRRRSTTVTGLLVAGTINADGGKLDFKSAITRADGVGALHIGSRGTLDRTSAKFRDRLRQLSNQ